MGTAPISTDKSPEQIATQIFSFILHIIISLVVYLALFFVLSVVNPTDMPALVVTLLVFALTFVVAYLIHMGGRMTSAPAIWVAGVVWLLMVMVYVLELPTGPGKCEFCTATSKIGLTLFDMAQGSNLMNGEGRVIGTWPALAMIGYAIGARVALRRHFRA
jgi:hypothetical protein